MLALAAKRRLAQHRRGLPAFWIGLALVWGLTVPHMILVARFDSRMRAARAISG